MAKNARFPRLPLRVGMSARMVAAVGLLALFPVTEAVAQAPKLDVAGAIQKIRSGDEARMRGGLDELRLAGPIGASGVSAIVEVLSRGLSESLTVQALDTLGDLESPTAAGVLGQYAAHRSVSVRCAAVRALGRTRSAAASAPLRKALSDSEASVRGLAATSLGTLKAKDATKDLVLALDHNVREAALALGQACSAEGCLELVAKIGKLPLEMLGPGVEAIVLRPDVPEEAKEKLLARMGKLETVEAHRFLKALETRLPKDATPKTRRAVAQAIANTTGAVR
jgi:HEAT repeat protein